MASKLSAFLSENKINPKRLIVASRQIERLRPEDRAIKLKQTQARKSEDGKKAEGLGKPRSGRTVTVVSLDRALGDQPISGPQKTRILRAVNRILEQQKKDAVVLDSLFDPPPPKAAAPAKGDDE